MNKHKLEWYIPETNTYLYDEDVEKLLKPKLHNSLKVYDSIIELIKSSKEELKTDSLVSKYLEYEEVLSLIRDVLEEHFESK